MYLILPKTSKLIFKTQNAIIQTGNGIILPTSSPQIKYVSHFYQGFNIDFQNRKWNSPNRKWNLKCKKWCAILSVSINIIGKSGDYHYEYEKFSFGDSCKNMPELRCGSI